MIILGDITAEQVLTAILDHECYNPDEAYEKVDINQPETWARRKYHIEGHCVEYDIVAERTPAGYRIVSFKTA